MSSDTWHEHVDATGHSRGVTHGMSHVVHLCERLNGAKCQGEVIWERKIRKQLEKIVRVTSGKGESRGKFPQLLDKLG